MGQDPRARTLTCAHQHSLGLPRCPCRPEQGKWHRCHPNHFPAAAGHWCGYSKISERMLEERDSSVHNLGGAHVGCSLRVKGEVRACEGRKQPWESSSPALGREDTAAALGVPCPGATSLHPNHRQCFRSVLCISCLIYSSHSF